MKKINLIQVLVFLLIFISCKKEVVKVDEKVQPESTIKYAKGFDIINDNGTKKPLNYRNYPVDAKLEIEPISASRRLTLIDRNNLEVRTT